MLESQKSRILDKFPFFIGGIFLIYLAVLDDSLFNFIINITPQSQFSVALATTIAAGLPMFFAVGFIKKTILRRWQTIYYYEKFLHREIYWILTVMLLTTISCIIVTQEGIHQFNLPVLAAGVLFSVYLAMHSSKINKNNPHPKIF